ncbi:MAG: DegT/DnrJ/EryC1/StrS family aminotransferase, partial [Lachnospiraceae bacterium]|nr:DegT/DnrJ/EryC1/StrS family aminotransferase [Lachnospiraceae bacterium]
LPRIPEGCEHNAHMFYMKAKDLDERTQLIAFLKERGVQAVFHYIPLHSAPAGKKYGVFHGEDVYTTRESERLVRLPMYYRLSEEDQNTVIEAVKAFYSEAR